MSGGSPILGWEIRTEFRKIPENFRFRTHFRPFFSDSDSASERKNRSRHRSPRSRRSYSLINYLPATNLRAFFRRKFPEFRNRRRKFRFRTLQRGVRFQRNSQPSCKWLTSLAPTNEESAWLNEEKNPIGKKIVSRMSACDVTHVVSLVY